MNALISNLTPIAIGTAIAGGFLGAIVGDNAIIVANKAEGETTIEWGTYGTEIEGANSYFDGTSNTAAMAAAGSPLALWAQSLAIGGFKWVIPSRDEQEAIYRNLKPTNDENTRYSGDNPTTGTYPYSDTVPSQTTIEAFQAGNAEAYEEYEYYWTSTQFSAHYSWDQHFDDGDQLHYVKSSALRARAVRVIPLGDLVL